MQTTTSPPDGDMVRVTTTKNKKISNEFCSVYKSNLSGGLTSLQDQQSGGSGAGPLNCGVLSGASVVCSHVGKLSLGKVLGVVL